VVAADETEVVAVVAGGQALAGAAVKAWDEGRAILPVNPAFTATETTNLLERLRPTHVAGPDGRPADFAAGVPAPAGTAATTLTSNEAAKRIRGRRRWM